VITDSSLSGNNPNNPTHTTGTTFFGQLVDHDVTSGGVGERADAVTGSGWRTSSPSQASMPKLSST